MIVLAAIGACLGIGYIAYVAGEHAGYKRGRFDGDQLVAVERQQGEWRLYDRRYNRATRLRNQH